MINNKLLFLLTFFITVIVTGFILFIFFGNKVLVYVPRSKDEPPKNIEKKTSSQKSLMYGVGVDMAQIIPGSDNYVLNKKGEDLIDLAHKLGVNYLRITNASQAFRDRPGSLFTKDEWYKVLDKMQSYGIRAIILIETPNLNPDDYSQNYLNLTNDYLIKSEVLNHPDVYAVDLRNEPTINIDKNVEAIKDAARIIKKDYPHILLTVGWWRIDTFKKDSEGKPIFKWDSYMSGKIFDDIIDFYSIHLYGFDKDIFGIYPDPYKLTVKFISDVSHSLDSKKPILIEEFGAGNGSELTDQKTIGSEQLQADTYEGFYSALIDISSKYNIMGSIAYTFYPKDKHSYGWNIISENGDHIYKAAQILQKYSQQNPKN